MFTQSLKHRTTVIILQHNRHVTWACTLKQKVGKRLHCSQFIFWTSAQSLLNMSLKHHFTCSKKKILWSILLFLRYIFIKPSHIKTLVTFLLSFGAPNSAAVMHQKLQFGDLSSSPP
ncbi:hypothetical protein ATANTOWER_015056 [Ataeniobius toweri]|uniref:Uncharacterized protein n=1 Tax=Ataeniobius toweri TaxID=208326 RepID=A0ABU7C9K9_9TELE|nr:hypothetical protein [Ataeniobius toweri]